MKDEQLLEALKAFPELKKQMEELLLVASNPESRRLSSHSVEIKHSNHILANPEKAFEK